MGKNPAHRVRVLLGKLKASRRGKERGYNPSKELIQTSNKFVRRVEKIFKILPKPMEWLSFLNHDLPLLMDFCEKVWEVSMQFLNDCPSSREKHKIIDFPLFPIILKYPLRSIPRKIGISLKDKKMRPVIKSEFYGSAFCFDVIPPSYQQVFPHLRGTHII